MVSVEQQDVVDFISIDQHTGGTILTIADHLPWGNLEHLYLLQEKINSYVAFVINGEILQAYPSANTYDVNISLVYRYEPVESAPKFFVLVENTLNEAGFKFRHEQLLLRQ